MAKAVLAVGLDPAFVDLSALAQAPLPLTPELIRHYIEAQIQALRERGFDAHSCLTDRGDTAEAAVIHALQARRYDCVVIGAGLREPEDLLPLFEKILNLVHALAPQARICFNTNPADTVEAVLRWIAP